MKKSEAVSGSSYGFEVCSRIPLKFVRFGGGNGTLNIRMLNGIPMPPPGAPLFEWQLRGSPNVTAKLHADKQNYQYFISDAGRYCIDPTNQTIWIPEHQDEIRREQRLWSVPALLCVLHRGDFTLHAAAAEVDGGAVLLAGPGYYGKTTLVLAFHKAGYRMLSEDSACCRLTPSPVLLPGPAILRIRPDMFDGCAPTGTHVVGTYGDRVYLALDEDRRGGDQPVPIKAIFFLRESTNEIHFEPVVPQKALPDLWALGFHLPNNAAHARSFRQLTGLAGTVPIWNLYRPMRIASLSEVIEKVVKVLS